LPQVAALTQHSTRHNMSEVPNFASGSDFGPVVYHCSGVDKKIT
jgi:hypothetical protein